MKAILKREHIDEVLKLLEFRGYHIEHMLKQLRITTKKLSAEEEKQAQRWNSTDNVFEYILVEDVLYIFAASGQTRILSLQGMFKDCDRIRSISLEEIEIIEGNMTETFSDCTALEEVIGIPHGMTDMTNTFSGCIALKTAPKLPDSAVKLYGVFSNCSALQHVPNIPQNAENMAYAFFNCKSLKNVPEIPKNVKLI